MTPTGTTIGTCRAHVRCYAELNELLADEWRGVDVPVAFDVSPSVKDLIERVGVPHTEVDLVLANGASVDFTYRVRDGDRIAAYPRFRRIDVASLTRVRPEPLVATRFVVDTHLGRLARYLRLAGFDTDYSNDRDDATLARIASANGRILLTRDRGLLERRAVTHGYLVRATTPREQLSEVLIRFDLVSHFAPFTRCTRCNGVLRRATADEVVRGVPARSRRVFERFRACPDCGRVYWEGSHYDRLARIVEDARHACLLPSGAHQGAA